MKRKKFSRTSKRRLAFFGTLSLIVIGYAVFSFVYYSVNLLKAKNENINLQLIVESALESYNKQLGAKSLNIQELNDNNKGLLKVFKDKKSYGKLAQKYKYGYMYNFFSGDIHLLSQIDKLIPFNTNHSKQYYDIYLNCILTLLKDYFLLINDYNTEVKVDVTKLNQIDFIEIKDS